jgi:NADH-quinone oxidoreductase subunit G
MQAAEFVVALTPFVSEQMKDYASVMIPVAPFSETSGTYVNAAGEWQSFSGAVAPLGDTRPAWRVLRVLGNLLDLDGFEYMSSEEVRDELRDKAGEIVPDNSLQATSTVSAMTEEGGLTRVSGVGIYAVDSIVRRAPALQQTADAIDVAVRLNSSMAEKLSVQSAQQVLVRQGGASASLPLVIDNSVADDCVWIPGGTAEASQLGAMVGSITLEIE